jgi:hypothetical protein
MKMIALPVIGLGLGAGVMAYRLALVLRQSACDPFDFFAEDEFCGRFLSG